MRIFNRFCLLAAAMLLSLPFAQNATCAPIVLKASVLQPEGDPSVIAFRDGFKKTFEEKTGGKYRIDIFTGGALGNCDAVLQGIQFGTLQFATESLANFSQFNPELGVFDLPYLIPDRESLTKVFKSPVGQRLFSKISDKGIDVLDFWLSTYRAICSTMPIYTLEDAQGKKIRTTNSRWHMEAVKSLGMSPTPMAPTEIITGLQQGVIAGTDTEYPSIISWHFIDAAKNVTLSDHMPCAWLLFTSKSWLNKQSQDVKDAVAEAVVAFNKVLVEQYDIQIDRTLKEIEEKYNGKVIRLSPEERQRWIEKSRPMYDSLPDNMRKLAQEIREVLK